MPTKLAKPITITITHVENAVMTAMKCHWTGMPAYPNASAIDAGVVEAEVFGQVEAALKERGIDWQNWKPEPPFTIGGHAVTFNDDGSARIGCTTVSAKEIEEFVKRRPSQAIYYSYFPESANTIWKVTPNGRVFECHRGGRHESATEAFSEERLAADAASGLRKILTYAEAAAIVGEENV